MPLTLSAAVQAEIAKKHMRFIELWRFKFDNSTEYKWALRNVPSATSFDGEQYDARIWRDSAKSLPRGSGKKSRSVDIRVRNDDGLLTTYINNGGSLFMGQVKVVRLFPDLNVVDPNDKVVGTWDNPYWFGWVKSVRMTRLYADLKVEYGLPELQRPFGRQFETSCTHTFKDDFLCPYNTTDGFGRPQPIGLGTTTAADAGSMTSDSDLVAFGVQVGDSALVMHPTDETQKTVGVVTAINVGGNPNKINVDNWRLSGTPGTAWNHVIGPEFTDCDYSLNACIQRGMKGPTSIHPLQALNKVQRDFFGGLTDPSQKPIPVRLRTGLLSFKRFNTLIQANEGLIGKPIPIPVGGPNKVRLKPTSWFYAGEFLHVIVPVGEARVGRITNISIQGFPPDNDDTKEGSEQDALVLYGFERYTVSGDTTNDSGAVAADGLTLRQVKEGIGIREGWAHTRRKTDSYLNNPWQFRDQNGNGYSFANCSHMMLRIQRDKVDINDLTVELTITEGVQMLKTDLSTWEGKPDLAEVALNACINARWGGGMDTSQLLVSDFDAASTKCRELVVNTQTEVPGIGGNVDDGPGDNEDGGEEEHEDGGKIATGIAAQPGSLIGGQLSVTVGGVPQVRNIVDAKRIVSRPKIMTDPQFGGKGGPFVSVDARVGTPGMILYTDQPWATGSVPSNGDSFTIATLPSRGRYLANGMLNNKEQKLEEVLEEIALNCNGGWYYHQGKLGFSVRTQENLTTINNRMTITDKGSTPNVIRRNGVGAEIEDLEPTKMNAIPVRFNNPQRDGEMDQFTIRNRAAQLIQKEKFSLPARDRLEKTLTLALTNTRDQAARVGTVYMRSMGIRSTLRPNVLVKVEMPAHLTMEMIPVKDVYPLDLDGIPDWIEYGRVESIEESLSKITSIVTFSVYVHADYDDTAGDTRPDVGPSDSGEDEGINQYRIAALSEEIVTDTEGNLVQEIIVDLTLPQQ